METWRGYTVDINGRRWRVQNGGKARCRVGGPSAEDADRSVPETMKHAFMDAAAKRLICCVACANQSTMHLNCCACACMFGHQYVRWSHGNASSGLRKAGHPVRAHHHMHTIGIGSLGSMLTPGEFTYVCDDGENWDDRKGKSRGLTSVLDMNSLGARDYTGSGSAWVGLLQCPGVKPAGMGVDELHLPAPPVSRRIELDIRMLRDSVFVCLCGLYSFSGSV
jgi:hypothetical protein